MSTQPIKSDAPFYTDDELDALYERDPLLAMISMGVASFFNDITLPGSWAACMDVGGKYVGTVSGAMNMIGNFGGMAGPMVIGLVLQYTNRDWQLVFVITSGIYSLGAFCWLFLDPVTPLEQANRSEENYRRPNGV